MTRSAILSLVASAAILLLAGGCKTHVGRDFQSARKDGIRLNETSAAQVREWLGSPVQTKKLRGPAGRSKAIFYQYASSAGEGATGRTLGIELVGDLVRGYLFDSSLPADSTEFDPLPRADLVEGETTRSAAEAALGPPSGRFALPSNMLADVLTKKIPEETAEALVWRSSETGRPLVFLKTKVRILGLFFDSAGILVGSKYESDRRDEPAPRASAAQPEE